MPQVRRRATALFAVTLAALVAGACTDSGTKPDGGDGGTATTVAPDPADGGWVRSASESLSFEQPGATLNEFLAPEGESDDWLVAGVTFDDEGRPKATVWRSDDAQDWAATPLPGGGLTEALAAHRFDGKVVVVGRERVGGGSRAAAWLDDGRTFTAVEGGDAFAGADQVSMNNVVRGPSGLVATGLRTGGGAAGAVTVWRSATGESWERVPAAEEVFARAPRPTVNRLVATTAGVVAVGTTGPLSDTDAAAWFSADGATWAQAPNAPDFAGPGVQALEDAVVTAQGGVLAVGNRNADGKRVPSLWRSADGRSWSPAPATFEQRDRGTDSYGTPVNAVARTTTGFVASSGDGFVKRVWTSPDAAAWAEVPLPQAADNARFFNLDLLAAAGDDILVGSAIEGIPVVALHRAGTWTEVGARSSAFPVPRPEVCCVKVTPAGEKRLVLTASAFGAAKALGRERMDARAYTSDDGGITWKRVTDTPFSHAEAAASAPVEGGGAVVVGSHPFEAGFAEYGKPAFLTWTSSDGAAWRRTQVARTGDTDQDFGSRRLTGVASRGRRVVAAGEAFREAEVDGVVYVRDGDDPFRQLAGVPGMEGPDDLVIGAVCAGPGGFLVGGSARRGTETDAAAWFSADGETWQQVSSPAFGGPGLARIDACASHGNGFVAAGVAVPGDAADVAVWATADGLAWTRVSAPALAADGPQSTEALVVDGDRWLVVGNDSRSEEFEVALWQSDDAGATWRRPPLGPVFRGHRTQQATGAVLAGGKVIVAGVVDGRPAAWSSPWPVATRGG